MSAGGVSKQTIYIYTIFNQKENNMLFLPSSTIPPFTREISRHRGLINEIQLKKSLDSRASKHLNNFGTQLITTKPTSLDDRIYCNAQNRGKYKWAREMFFGIINYLENKSVRKNLCKLLFPQNENTRVSFDFAKLSHSKLLNIFSKIYLLTNISIRVYEECLNDGVFFKKIYDNILHTKLSPSTLKLEIILTKDKRLLLVDNPQHHVSKHFAILSIFWPQSEMKPSTIIDENELLKILAKRGVIDNCKQKLSDTLTLYSKIKNIDHFCEEKTPEGLKKNVLFYHCPNIPAGKTINEESVQLLNNSYQFFDQWRNDELPVEETVYIYLYFDRMISKFKFILTSQPPSGYENVLKTTGSGVPEFTKDIVSGYYPQEEANEDNHDPGEIRKTDECFCPKTFFTRTRHTKSLPLGKPSLFSN